MNDLHDGELFGKMSSDLGYVFPILNGKIQEYQNESMGIFVINVDNEHFGKVTEYLDKKQINWRELEVVDEEEEEEE